MGLGILVAGIGCLIAGLIMAGSGNAASAVLISFGILGIIIGWYLCYKLGRAHTGEKDSGKYRFLNNEEKNELMDQYDEFVKIGEQDYGHSLPIEFKNALRLAILSDTYRIEENDVLVLVFYRIVHYECKKFLPKADDDFRPVLLGLIESTKRFV